MALPHLSAVARLFLFCLFPFHSLFLFLSFFFFLEERGGVEMVEKKQKKK